MSDMGGKRTSYYIVDYSKLDAVSKRMLCVFLAVWKVWVEQIWDRNTSAILKAAGKTPLLMLAL